jgi:uncharacterized lipoprotein YddW (UPF0748 family)
MSRPERRGRSGLVAAGTLALVLVATSAPAAEGRAVWIHAGMFSADENKARAEIVELLTLYQATGLNTLYCFDSLMAQHRKGWDFLAVLVDEAHRRGMTVHPVICPGHDVRLDGEIKEHPEWLIRGMKGEVYPNLNLASPGARARVLREIADALERGVDGIHLDYIRFPVNQNFSYDTETVEAFKKEFGQSPLEGAHDSGSMIWCEWIKWNAAQVTTLVRSVRQLLANSGKTAVLSAAVFPDRGIAPVEIGQDWARWAEDGLVDVLCPMLYTSDARLFRSYVREAVRVGRGRARIYAGIACVSSHNKNTPDGVVQQVAIAREEGADGVAFFSGYSLGPEFRAALASAVFGKVPQRR